MIGVTDQANHQYDLSASGPPPTRDTCRRSVILKAPAYQDGHAVYSDPLDEQTFLVNTINHLQKLPRWKHMAIVISYDDSDGWYDHAAEPIVSHSNTTMDGPAAATDNTMSVPARCGYGPRLPLLLISPYAKRNYVSHTVTDQKSDHPLHRGQLEHRPHRRPLV